MKLWNERKHLTNENMIYSIVTYFDELKNDDKKNDIFEIQKFPILRNSQEDFF